MNFFLKRYKDLGHDLDPKELALRQSIRVNTLRVSEDSLLSSLKRKKVFLKKIGFTDHGYWVEADFALSSTAEYLHGYFYIQEAASQVPVQVLAPQKTDVVLDMCAAPGSKTTQIAQYMMNQGTLIALDSNSARLSALKNNLERCGIKNCLLYQKDAAHAADLGKMFDKILLDAPCSGNFMTDKGWFDKRDLGEIKSLARTQKSLLRAAVQVLKPEGTLVYSTCSLEPEDNEDIIEWALDELPVELVSTGLRIGDSGINDKNKLCRRFWPEKTGTQGFFIAKLRLKA